MLMNSIVVAVLCGSLLVTTTAAAQTLTQFNKTSTTTRPYFIELYTSQGCSSCPPAETWLSAFSKQTELWHKYFPIAFHVTYWDYIGWKDHYATKENGQRQSRYENLKND